MNRVYIDNSFIPAGRKLFYSQRRRVPRQSTDTVETFGDSNSRLWARKKAHRYSTRDKKFPTSEGKMRRQLLEAAPRFTTTLLRHLPTSRSALNPHRSRPTHPLITPLCGLDRRTVHAATATVNSPPTLSVPLRRSAPPAIAALCLSLSLRLPASLRRSMTAVPTSHSSLTS